ncbi:phage tail tape measure protein, TP901 family, core region [Seinonella peptonophila]|uniref:Phage tail tape measure protein, TP901 family, core region n=1 Tax=Seinonella peptonophila TaxID=112248 RepID=A0A1M4VAW5_9BACL|nr:phage tail tape measure protein [Seinonella peptonophila]SHE66114.1 phage tail tape measure protein, TP901 family, core region [Seinonella peptonophila]
MSTASVTATFTANATQLMATLASVKAALKATGDSMSKVGADVDSSMKKMGASATVAAGEIESAGAKSSAGMKKSFGELDNTMKKSGINMQEIGLGMGAAMTVAGAAIAVGLGVAVSKAADFEAQIDRVGAISGASSTDMQKLRQSALDLGASTSKSATEVAQGMELMAASGYKTNDIIAAMPGVIAAAEASGEDFARVTEVVTSALNGFGLEAKEATRVADIMAMSANQSRASVDDLGFAFKYAAPVAKQLGVSIEELAAATGIMVDAGLEGSQAGTTLRMAFLRLADPPKEAKAAIEQLGVTLFDAQGKMLPMGTIIGQLSEKFKGMSQQQKVAAASTIFGTEAATGMLAVIDKGPAKFNSFTNALKNSGGAAQETAKKMKDNLKGAMEQMSGSWETLAISIGTTLTPAVRAAADAIKVIADAFNSLPAPVQSFIGIALAVVSALLLIGGVVMMAYFGLQMLATSVGIAASSLVGIIAGVAGAIVGIIALGAVFVYAYNKIAWFRQMVDSAWSAIKAGFAAVVAFLQPAVQAVVNFVVQQWQRIQQWWSQSGPMIVQAAQNVFNFLKIIITGAMNVIMAIFSFVWPAILAIITFVWSSIKGVISGALGVIMAVINIFAALFTGNWSALWEAVKSLLSNALTLIWNLFNLMLVGRVFSIIKAFGTKALSFFKSTWSSISSGVSNFLSRIGSFFTSKFNAIKSYITSVLNSIKSYFSNIFNSISSTVSSILSRIYSAISSRFNAAKSVVMSAINSMRYTIQSGFNAAASTVSNVASRIRSLLSGLASQAMSWGRNLINMFAQGIQSAGAKVIAAAKNIADKVKSFLGFSSPTEKGPASDSDTWAPNFVDMFAQGLNANSSKLKSSVLGLASEMSLLSNGVTVSGYQTVAMTSIPSTNTGQTSASTGDILITGNTFNVRNDNDIKEIAREIRRQENQELRAKGRII